MRQPEHTITSEADAKPTAADAPGPLAPGSWPPSPEDSARASIYALLARLYADGPDAALLAAIANSERISGDTLFAAAWNQLADASGAIDAKAAAQEYTDLFIGVGKSEVNLHASHWQVGAMMERPLVELRSDLAALGHGRRAEVTMLEDHQSALCETMRMLIAGGPGTPAADISVQRTFFAAHVTPWVFDCCNAIRDSAIANYYVHVAELTDKFMALDRDALAMDG
jgi:TorA maturation chaperone TorD